MSTTTILQLDELLSDSPLPLKAEGTTPLSCANSANPTSFVKHLVRLSRRARPPGVYIVTIWALKHELGIHLESPPWHHHTRMPPTTITHWNRSWTSKARSTTMIGLAILIHYSESQSITMFKFYNYRFMLAKVSHTYSLFQLILLFMNLFCCWWILEELLGPWVLILLFMTYFFLYASF
jgi:hypothetical protein